MLKNHPPYFGAKVAVAMLDWWNNSFLLKVRAEIGSKAFTVVVLDPMADLSWRTPYGTGQANILIQMSDGKSSEIAGAEGLTANVEHKLRWVLRTGFDSVESTKRKNRHLIVPGDFAFAGAGTYRGLKGGCSGFDQFDDVKVFEWFVDELALIRSDVAEEAVPRLRKLPGFKYLEPNWDS